MSNTTNILEGSEGKPYRILVCGSRHWTDEDTIRAALAAFPSNTLVIHGDNGNANYTRGADRIAARIAKELFDCAPLAFPADWDRYGLAAGPRRNREMAETRPDVVLAFHDDIEKSKGTKHMVGLARGMGIPVAIISNHVAPRGNEHHRKPRQRRLLWPEGDHW